jgi:hypothetical protein
MAAVLDGPGPGAAPVVALVDATDPARPVPLARWTRPPGGGAAEVPPPACEGSAAAADARLPDGAQRLLVTYGDGGVYDLDLADPARPVVSWSVPAMSGASGPAHGAEVALVRTTVAVVTNGGCPGGPPPDGVRLLGVGPRQPVSELPGVRYPGPGSPGRLAVSGELAFVTWHAGGLRVLDLGQVQAATVAQFVPPAADVVGVAVLARDLVVTDTNGGLYVLERPAEGHAESFWDKVKGAAGFMSIPVIFGAIWAVPRLAMGHSPASSRSRVPARVGGQRRR